MPKFSPNDFFDDLCRVVSFCKKEKLEYLLVGGLALGVWGRPRTTLDLDFMVLVSETQIGILKNSLRSHGFKIDTRWAKWNPLLRSLQVRVQGKSAVVDMLIPRDDHDRDIFKRRKRKKLFGQMIDIVCPEDLILQKLKVGRPHDFEDALSVLERMRGKLDTAYLRRWSSRLGVTKELEYIRSL